MSLVEVDVAIVGAGPVGLTAALALTRRGISVAVLEELEQPSTEWRASTFHPPTLEMARDLGIVDEMVEQGLKAAKSQYRDRQDGVFAEFDLSMLAGDTDFPFRLQLEQYKYVRILSQALRAADRPVEVSFGHGVVGLEDLGEGIELSTSAGTRVRAPWVIAADGARSTVRKELGVPFDGSTYEHRYLVLSIDYPLPTVLPGICEVNYIADPEEHLLLLRVPDLWRVVLSVAPEISNEEAVSAAYVRQRLRLLVGDDVELPVTESKVYSVHQRVAERFRVGRHLLVGDAAHINSPMGGMGLNSGIHDAFDLATQLEHVLQSGADDARLDDWAERRRRVAREEISKMTHETTTALTEKREETRSAHRESMAGIARDPRAARDWLLESSMISNVLRHQIPGLVRHVDTSASPDLTGTADTENEESHAGR